MTELLTEAGVSRSAATSSPRLRPEGRVRPRTVVSITLLTGASNSRPLCRVVTVVRCALHALYDGPVFQHPHVGAFRIGTLILWIRLYKCLVHYVSIMSMYLFYSWLEATYTVHAQVVADAVLPPALLVLVAISLGRIVSEPLVDFLERHASIWLAH